MDSERREHVRFQTKDNAYASFGSGFTKVGSLKDISQGGLSFEYIFCDELSSEPASQVDIFQSSNGFHLENIPCSLIYDVPIRTSMNNLFIVKRCGLKFSDLSDRQKLQIHLFIENYTAGLAQKPYG